MNWSLYSLGFAVTAGVVGESSDPLWIKMVLLIFWPLWLPIHIGRRLR